MRRVSLGSWLICLLSQVFGGSDRDVPLRAELPMKTPPDSHVDNKEVADDAEESDANWNVTFKTFGGRQFWGDVRFFRGWRIQQNAITKHYRLLDSEDRRQAWGTLEQCAQKLEKSKRDLHLAPMSGKAVVLVHGIIRSSKSLNSLKQRLTEEGYTVVGFDYPSTRVTIPESADYLQQVLSSLEGIEEIDFVVHSMGGLLVRAWSRDHEDSRVKRMVMLGVPNLGAEMATRFQDWKLFKTVFGPAGQQLTDDPQGLIADLPTPRFEFAVVSGARGNADGWNPLVPGDDDGTVSVASTRLPGAADFMTVPVIHTFLIRDERAIDATCRFLKKGSLRESGLCEPITPTEVSKP